MHERFRAVGERSKANQTRPAGSSLTLAHDFRNQLQLAASSARVVRREMLRRSDGELASILEDGLRALDRAGLLAQRLSVPQATSSEPQDVWLQRLVPEMRSLLSHALGDDIDFASLVSDDLPPLRCDPLELENVLVNLALNARQAMPLGGRLVMEAARCTDGDHYHCVSLSVSDSGAGMADDVAAKAFEPYFSTRLLDGGTGLGLYNARCFAQALGGSVDLATRENQGTRVILHLPVSSVSRR